MARGSKAAYTQKQKRKAHHIEEGYKAQGASNEDAARIGWATVNKESGGGKTASKASTAKKKAAPMKRKKTARKK